MSRPSFPRSVPLFGAALCSAGSLGVVRLLLSSYCGTPTSCFPSSLTTVRSLSGSALRRRNRSSQVPRRPSPHMPRSTTPVEPTRAGLRGFAPTSCSLGVAFQVPRLVGLHDSCLSGPDSAACVLAVYASCRSLPSAHARLAFGWRPCLGRAGFQPAGSLSWFRYILVTYSPPRRGLLGARETAALRREWGHQNASGGIRTRVGAACTSSALPRALSPVPSPSRGCSSARPRSG